MIVAVLSLYALSAVAPFLYRLLRGRTGWVLALLPLGLTAYFATAVHQVSAGTVLTASLDWVPSLGIGLSMRLDGLSLLFALLICGIGALVLVYGGGYLSGHVNLGRFYAIILMFMASMLGLVLADNLIALYIFWEMTSITSYLLIGFDQQRAEARSAALQALMVTSLGGLAMLAGLILLGQIGGSLEISMLLNAGEMVSNHRLYLPVLLLILAGAFTKSAQVPFHFWLPNAMEAPTPVSAYLHSATMVKAGVYLLARLTPIVGGTDDWLYIVAGVGGVTMVVTAYMGLQHTDLKRILAYSTVSMLGTMTMLLGLGTQTTVKAAMALLLAHALYKGALFLVAGAVDHEAGTRDVRLLRGLLRAMPVTATASFLAALSMAGLPPLFGFVSKEVMYDSTLHADYATLVTIAAVAANVIMTALAGVVGARPFLGKPLEMAKAKAVHEAPPALWLGPLVLAALSLAAGLATPWMGEFLVVPAAGGVLNSPVSGELSLWHGWNLPLALSAVTVASGVAVYAARDRIRGLTAAAIPQMVFALGPDRLYEWALAGMNALARGQTRLLQGGYLRYYVLMVIATVVMLVGATLIDRGGLHAPSEWTNVRFYEAGLAVLILLAALAAAVSTSRLGAVAALGVVGYGVAVIYVLFGAPDLAITQFMVETLTVILFLLVFYHLPRFTRLSGPAVRVRDALIALAAGGLVTALVLVATSVQLYPSISDYFAEQSLPQAHGRNIVNVILVDFRALDTLGEITVLGVAGIGVFALLKLRLARRSDDR